jgi:hypothetical protein
MSRAQHILAVIVGLITGVLLIESYGAMVDAARAGGRAIPELAGATPVWLLGSFAVLSLLYRAEVSADQPTDRPEVLVSGEGLQRGPVDVLGTLLHEAAHGLAHTRKVSDTSRQGRYHNRRYATWPASSASEVTHHLDPIGWSATSVPDPTAACYAEVLAELGAALVLWRRAEQPGRAGPVPQRLGLLLRMWSAHPGGPLGAGAGPHRVRRLRQTLPARGGRGALTRTRQ